MRHAFSSPRCGSKMISHLYRFRSTLAVLDGFEELNKQEIYFSPPDQLNDPMEGYKDVFWSGDRIVWQNLLRHYVLCLLQTASLVFVMGPQFNSADLKIVVLSVPENLPEAPIASHKIPTFEYRGMESYAWPRQR
jgi:hypothetical protein